MPSLLWWSRSRVRGGWLYELADDGEADLASLLPQGQRLEVTDLQRGMRRIAVLGPDKMLRAALFITRTGQLPARDWVAAQLDREVAQHVELLAGRPAGPQRDRGAMVCVCHGVGAHDVREAACAGALTIDAIGKATCAGTNCGSCRPAIARLIEQVFEHAKEAAE